MSRILDAAGRPVSPPTPHDVIRLGGLPAINLFNALGDRAAQLTMQIKEMDSMLQALQVIAGAAVGLRGGQLVIPEPLQQELRDHRAGLSVTPLEGGALQVVLIRQAGDKPVDPATAEPMDLTGFDVACRAAAAQLSKASAN